MADEVKSKREPYYISADGIKRLEGLEADIKFFESELQRAEYVGLDVTELRKRTTKMKDVRIKMIETYRKPAV